MKRLVTAILTFVMTLSTFGMTAFADDSKTAEQPNTQKVSTEKTNAVDTRSAKSTKNVRDLVYLKKTSYAWYNKVGDGAYDPTRVEDILNNIAYTTAGKDSDFDIDDYATTTVRTSKGKTITDPDRELTPGKYSLIIKADNPYTGTAEFPFEVRPFKVTAKNLYTNTSAMSYRYTGKNICPKFTYIDLITIYTDGLKNGRDYIINYKYKNNKNYGTATVTATITFKGNYTGSVNVKQKFYVAPQKAVLKRAKAGKKSVKVKWSKSKDASGYRISIHNAKGNLVKTRMIKGKKKTSCTIKGLKRHKTYYVTVNPYRKVKGKKAYGYYGKVEQRDFRTK